MALHELHLGHPRFVVNHHSSFRCAGRYERRPDKARSASRARPTTRCRNTGSNAFPGAPPTSERRTSLRRFVAAAVVASSAPWKDDEHHRPVVDWSFARPHERVHVIEEAQVQPRHDLEHQVLGLPARRVRRPVRLMEPAPGLEHTPPEGNLGPDL